MERTEKMSNSNIVVFASGNGSNAENLISYFRQHPEEGEVVLVVTNRQDAGVIGRAERLGVDCKVLTRAQNNDPDLMLPLLESYDAKLIILAGFLLMIPDFLVEKYNRRIINIHPSLLPKFGGKGMYGANVHKAVVEAGEKETGITIHYVTEKCDEGDHIFQARVPVSAEDTPESVEDRIHQLEKKYFPQVVARMLGDMQHESV